MKPGISQDINDTILQLQNETIESLFGEEIPSISALKSGFDWTHFSNDLEDPVAPYFPGSAYLREQAAQSRKELMKLRRPEEVL